MFVQSNTLTWADIDPSPPPMKRDSPSRPVMSSASVDGALQMWQLRPRGELGLNRAVMHKNKILLYMQHTRFMTTVTPHCRPERGFKHVTYCSRVLPSCSDGYGFVLNTKLAQKLNCQRAILGMFPSSSWKCVFQSLIAVGGAGLGGLVSQCGNTEWISGLRGFSRHYVKIRLNSREGGGSGLRIRDW